MKNHAIQPMMLTSMLKNDSTMKCGIARIHLTKIFQRENRSGNAISSESSGLLDGQRCVPIGGANRSTAVRGTRSDPTCEPQLGQNRSSSVTGAPQTGQCC